MNLDDLPSHEKLSIGALARRHKLVRPLCHCCQRPSLMIRRASRKPLKRKRTLRDHRK